MKKSDDIIIDKIISYCELIEEVLNRCEYDKDKFYSDFEHEYTCSFCIQQIGELSSRLSDEYKKSMSNIPWRIIKDTRNFHAHDYERIDRDLLWENVSIEIIELKNQLRETL